MKKIQVLVTALLVGLSSFAQETIKIKIKENLVPCTGVAPMECMQIQEGKSKGWTYFYDQIEGFEFEPGFTYKLKVEKTKREGKLPADVSAYQYKLKKVMSKKKVKESKVKQNAVSDIFNKKLVLTQLNGKEVTNGSVFFEMDKATNSISGKSGVNRFNSTFDYKNNMLLIKPGMSTLMAGDPKAMELENEFNKAISTPFKVVQKGNEVQFLNANTKQVVMVFNIPSENDIWSFINEKEWKLFMLDNVGRDFGSASIQFNVAEKKVFGNNGCNRFFGSYTTSGDEISFEGLGSTRMACMDKDANETEHKMMQYLNEGTLRFDVAEQTLNFYQGDRLVMVFGLQF